MRNLVKNYTITGGGKAVEVPIYSAVSASAVNEATDLSNTAIDPTSVTITASGDRNNDYPYGFSKKLCTKKCCSRYW
jgi:hypothetical protein